MKKDSEEKEKMSRVLILSKEQYRDCKDHKGRLSKVTAQRLSDENFRRLYR